MEGAGWQAVSGGAPSRAPEGGEAGVQGGAPAIPSVPLGSSEAASCQLKPETRQRLQAGPAQLFQPLVLYIYTFAHNHSF